MVGKTNSFDRIIGKLAKKEQFDFVLQLGKRVSTKHFVLHFKKSELSTDDRVVSQSSVDNPLKEGLFLGMIIPKRYAKQSVRRSLIKRLCRSQFVLFSFVLPTGSYVVRLKRELDASYWVSASSNALKNNLREELHYLFSLVENR